MKNKLVKRASIAAFSVSMTLLICKVFAWFITGSVVILTTFVDSLMDVISTGLNLIAVKYAILPADDDHKFGHGKAESLAALAQATFVSGSALFLCIQAIDRILHPRELTDLGTGLYIMVFSMICTSFLVLYQRYVIKKTNSSIVKAVSLNFTMDLVTNFTVVIALSLSSFGYLWIDPVFAILIGLLVFYNAYQIGVDAIHHLMDREIEENIREDIFKIACNIKNVLGIHGFRTRQSGQVIFVYLHIEIDEQLSFIDAHQTCDNVINAIAEKYPNTEIFAHQDPVDKSIYTPLNVQ